MPAAPPYRVLIEAEKLGRPFVQGTQRYVRGLLEALLAPGLATGWDLSILLGGQVLPLSAEVLAPGREDRRGPGAAGGRPATQRPARLPGATALTKIRRTLGRRRISRRARRRWGSLPPFDLAHLTTPHSSRSLDGYPGRLVGTVLDTTHLACPQHHLAETIAATHRGLSRMAQRASAVVAISRQSGDDFIRCYGFPPERVHVVPLGVDHSRFRPASDPVGEKRLRDRHGLARPFLLVLGTIEPRKNLEGVARAWLRLKESEPELDVELVVAGRPGWKTAEIRDWLERGRGSGVREIGYVDDDELPDLFRAALGLCYVSHYEGFGLPLLEAMSCGLPVVYGDNSAMRELVGSAGLAADSRSVTQIEQAMRRLIRDAPLRRELSRRSLDRAARYSWERTARETLSVYAGVLEARAREAGSSPASGA